MRYRFIDEHKKAWPVNLMCGVLEVSRSGYYDWTGRGPSQCAQSNRALDRRIHEIFDRPALEKVLFNEIRDIFGLEMLIKDAFRLNDQDRPIDT